MRESWDRTSARVGRLTSRLDGWPRRTAAAACLILALVTFVGSARNRRQADVRQLWIASRSLAAGTTLTTADVIRVEWPAQFVPPAALSSINDVVGRPIGAPIGRGEPLTTNRMLDTATIAGLQPDQVAAPVLLPDRGQRAFLHVGSSVDLYAAAPDPGSPAIAGSTSTSTRGATRPLVSDVRVLAVLPAPDAGGDNRLTVLVAVDRDAAARLAGHGSTPLLATLVRPP